MPPAGSTRSERRRAVEQTPARSAWDDGSERLLCPYDVEEDEDDDVPACDVRRDEGLAQPGDHLLYAHDRGDEWNHRLVVG